MLVFFLLHVYISVSLCVCLCLGLCVCVCMCVGQGSKHAAVYRPAVPLNGGAADDAAAADGGGPEVAGAGGKAAGNTHSEHSRKYTHKHTSHIVHGTHKEACSIENKPRFAAIFRQHYQTVESVHAHIIWEKWLHELCVMLCMLQCVIMTCDVTLSFC